MLCVHTVLHIFVVNVEPTLITLSFSQYPMQAVCFIS